MMIEKRPSGSYRIRKGYNGKMYSVTVDHKPRSEKEAEALIDAKIKKTNFISKDNATKTYDDAFCEYIEIKKNVLSPSTIRGYQGTHKQIPDWFKDMRLERIQNSHVQKVINDYSANHSPKTVANMYGLIYPVMNAFIIDLKLNVTLPQKVVKHDYWPTQDDVRRILEYAKGSAYESALILAAFGLRRSEILALELTDLNGTILTVNKALVQNENKDFVLKTTKTTDSTRIIPLPEDVADRLREIGMYKGYANSINKYLTRAQDKLGIPHFNLHKFRHFFATEMSSAIGEANTLKMGGWSKDSSVMKKVYQHAEYERSIEEQKKAVEHMRKLF